MEHKHLYQVLNLIPDTFGDLSGSFFFREPFSNPLPPLRFTTGRKTFKLSSSETNAERLKGSLIISSAETTYDATGGSVNTITQTEGYSQKR